MAVAEAPPRRRPIAPGTRSRARAASRPARRLRAPGWSTADLARDALQQLRPAGPVPGRDGPGPGRLVDRRTAPAWAACRTSRSWRPGCSPPRPCRPRCPRRPTRSWAGSPGTASTTRCRDPADADAIVLGHLAWIAIRLTLVGASSWWSSSPFGAAASPGSSSRCRRRLTALAFAAPIMAFMSTQRDTVVQRALPLRDHAAVPVLGHVLPDRAAAGAIQRIAWLPPLWHGVDLARGLALGTTWRTRSPRSRTSSCCRVRGRRRRRAARHVPPAAGALTMTQLLAPARPPVASAAAGRCS